MTDPLRLFIVAGEHSGDVLGADLVRALRLRTKLELAGVGGPELEGLGLTSFFPMSDLAVMGWADVLPRLPLLLRRARQVSGAIVRTAPDVVVMVDAQVFSAAVARQVRNAGGRMAILLYVAPSVWAWKPGRARKLAGVFDEVLAVLPFEPAVMERLGGPPTHYVGHPATERLAFRETLPASGPVLLLPGSRAGEVRRHMPLMRAVATALQGNPKVTGFVIPTVDGVRARIESAVAGWPVRPEIVTGANPKKAAFAAAIGACAVLGTVTLELAASGVPMVAVYRPEGFQIARIGPLGIRHYSLPNIIAEAAVVPEVLYAEKAPRCAIEALAAAIADGRLQLEGFRRILARMTDGEPGATRVNAADRVLSRAGVSAR